MNKRLLRLSLFQLGMGFSVAVFNGSLNRVLIAEEGIPATIVGWLLSLSIFVAPLRVIMGMRSDKGQKKWGYRRMPYVWYGSMFVFAGLSAAPFSLIFLSQSSAYGPNSIPLVVGVLASTLIFLAYAVGTHVAQTGYLALVTDLIPKHERGRAVAFLWTALIVGQVISALVISVWLQDYQPGKLVQVMQTASLVFVILAVAAVWKQDPFTKLEEEEEVGGKLLFSLLNAGRNKRFFAVVFLGTLGLTMQDVLLEPYGGQVLGMSVSETSRLTALWGVGMLIALLIAGRVVPRLKNPMPVATAGAVLGLFGLVCVTSASATGAIPVFLLGVGVIGVANGLFLISILALVMSLADRKTAGLYVGLWGLVQTTAMGLGSVLGGAMRDTMIQTTGNVTLGYTAVYALELGLLVIASVLLLTLPRQAFSRVGADGPAARESAFVGLTDIPG